MKNFRVDSYNKAARRRRQVVEDTLASYKRVRERSIKHIIESLCEKAQIPYMRNRDVKLVKTRDGKIIPAPIGDSQKGKPDLTIVGFDSKTIWIETKAPDGKLSEAQLRWKAALEERGHEYHSPRTIDEAHAVGERILKFWR